MNHSFYIEHLGCAKNRVDAQRMIDSLLRDGWTQTSEPEQAEAIIVNTCGFIEPAKQESIEVTLALRAAYPGKRLILAGCLAERYQDELSGSLSEVDDVFGNKHPEGIVTIFDETHEVTDETMQFTMTEGNSGYLKISEGCANNCSFCAIPLIRGPLVSRPVDDILSDVHSMLEAGGREINLIAQDIASYGTDRRDYSRNDSSTPFLDLLEQILAIDGHFWLRMLYIHPDHFPLPLLDLVAQEDRLLPYFDLPFQHASTPILKAMGRRGSSERHLELISTIREKLPDSVIRSTLLVGFPGETREDREALLTFQEKASIDWLGIFEYSHEEGTTAYALGAPSARDIKKAHRLREEIERRQTPICESRMDRFVGRTMQVLIEEPMSDVDLAIGRAYIHAPEVDANVVVHGEGFVEGEMYDCRIIKRNGIDLEGVVG